MSGISCLVLIFIDVHSGNALQIIEFMSGRTRIPIYT